MIEIVSDEMLLRSLLGVHEDYHEPQSARYVIDTIAALDHGICALTITVAIDQASWVTRRPNTRTRRWLSSST